MKKLLIIALTLMILALVGAIPGKAEAGLHQIFSGANAITLSRGSFEYVLPQWWGALGDDSKDDTTAIQAAIDAVGAAGGGIVFFPPGTYKITDTLTVDAGFVRLVGSGQKNTIIRNYGTGGETAVNIATRQQYSYTSIEDISIHGNPGSGAGVQIVGRNRHTVRNVHIYEHGGNGLDLSGELFYSLFENIYCRDNGGDGFHLDTFGVSNHPSANTFINCNAISNDGDGFEIEEGNGNTVIGGNMESNTGYGLRIGDNAGNAGTDSNRFLGFWCEANTAGAIRVGANSIGDYIMPGKIGGSIDSANAAGFNLPPRNSAQNHANILGSSFVGNLIGNLKSGYGNTLTVSASELQAFSGATVVKDAYALDGNAIKFDLGKPKCKLENILSPYELSAGHYRAYCYGKSDSGGKVQFFIKNDSDGDNLNLITSVVPPGADVFHALPTGGMPFTVDETENDDSIRIQVDKKPGPGAGSIYISHILIIPVGDVEYPFSAFDADDTTPSVLAGTRFKTANTGPTTITMLDDGYDGKQVIVVIGDANTNVDFTGTNLKGNDGIDWTPITGDHMTCVSDGTDWYCDVSDNNEK